MEAVQKRPSVGQRLRNYVVGFYQTQRNALVVLLTLGLGLYVLTGPDQATDMINAVIYTGVFSALFQFILFSAFVWGWVVYGSTRLLLHIAPTSLQLTDECQRLLRWLPRIGGMLPTLILAYAFGQFNHWQPYLLLLESGFMLWLFRRIEQRIPTFHLPTNWNFPGRQHTLGQALRILWRNPLGRRVTRGGIGLTLVLLLLFSLPVDLQIARYLRPTAIIILGISTLTFWASLLMYANDFRYRPLALLVIGYLVLASAFNDNTAVRRRPPSPIHRAEYPPVVEHFRQWVRVRRQADNDTIPLLLVAAEGGGIRALNWTAETLIRLDSIIPGFSRHVYALSGVSGGGVGTVFYTAFLHDFSEQTRQARFEPFRRVIRDDYLSAVSAALLFPDALQRFLPFPVAPMERAKWLEDSWAASYQKNLRVNTLDSSLTSLYQTPSGYNYNLPSLLLNGTMAESGQKTITSNLKLDPHYFTDVVPILDVLNSDVPLKTAASLCSRFPVVTNGALIQKDSVNRQGKTQRYGGHVVDGGYFDNSGVETCIQLLNNLVPTILALDSVEHVHVIPYILFIKNSHTQRELPQKRSVLQEVQVPLLAFLNAWDNGSNTRDRMFGSFMNRFERPKTNYLTLRLAYNANYPLGWFLSDSMARTLSQQAKDSISLKNPDLVRLKSTFRRLTTTPALR